MQEAITQRERCQQNMKKNSQIFSRRLRELRGDVNKSKFGRLLGISNPSTYHNYEQGRIPDSQTVKDIAEKCGVSVDWMLGMSDEKNIGTACRIVREPRADYGPSPPSLVQALDVVATSLGATREEVFDQFCAMVKKRMREDDCEKSA
jgi:transcriptional regulator with XRE-family HTH domain